MFENEPIKLFLSQNVITQQEYEILFSFKDTWYDINLNGNQYWQKSLADCDFFADTLEKVIKLMRNNDIIDLSQIYFPFSKFMFRNMDTSKKISFKNATFYSYVDFNNITFQNEIDFSDATFMSKAMFISTIFKNNAYFKNCKFKDECGFNHSVFYGEANFNDALFNGKSYFQSTIFQKNATFEKTTFLQDAHFGNVKFVEEANLSRTKFKENLFAYKMQFSRLNLIAIEFKNTNLLGISAYDQSNLEHGKTPTKANFANKETARLIKAHFETQNNITESNKYFTLEQDLYLDELKDKNSTEPNRCQTIITLILNKYVSNFGTDWLRSLLSLIIMGYLFMIGYMGLDSLGWLPYDKEKMIAHFTASHYIPYSLSMISVFGSFYLYTLTYRDKDWLLIGGIYLIWSVIIVSTYSLHPWDFSCYIVQITNPIGAFKDVELYKGIEFYATIVRITIAVMIYQLIVAFRNNTRRS